MTAQPQSPRVEELLTRFGERLHLQPFTETAVPSSEEVSLTRELWRALTDDERHTICDNLKTIKARGDDDYRTLLPDQRPLAMRVTHKYFKRLADERRSGLTLSE